MAYILSLLRQPAGSGNDSTLLEEEEEEEENSDVEDGDITMLDTEVTKVDVTLHGVTINPSSVPSFPFSYVDRSLIVHIQALLQAIDVLKKEVLRQREEKEVLEANVRETVVSEMMEVINEMQNGFRYVCRCSC